MSRVSINKSAHHTRSLVHIHKYNNVTPNYVMMDLVLKHKSDVAYAHLVKRVIVFGISRYHNGVPMSIWDEGMEGIVAPLIF